MLTFVDSTCPPSAVEIEEAQLALQRDGEELLHIGFTISSPQADIEVQQEKRRAAQSPIFISRAQISPMRFLPTDILQRIFIACLPDHRYITPDIQSSPLLLLQICRRWRDVAETTSELWSSIVVNARINMDSYTAMVARWLAASHNRPLAVALLFVYHDRPTPSEVFRLLVSHSVLIHDLHIGGNSLDFNAFLAGISPDRLSLDMMSECTPMVPDDSLTNSSCTSNVTQLVLDGVYALPLIVPAAFPQLTHLILVGTEHINFMKILIDFPALVKLETKLGYRSVKLPPAVPIVHRALEILCIHLTSDTDHYHNGVHLSSTFDSLFLPSLRVLAFFAFQSSSRHAWIHAQRPDQESVKRWLPESVKALFGRSSCLAKQLLYRGFELPQDMNGLCEQLRSVAVDLRVDTASFNDELRVLVSTTIL
jgi:hypothetical protein